MKRPPTRVHLEPASRPAYELAFFVEGRNMKHYTPMISGYEMDLLNPRRRRDYGGKADNLAAVKAQYRRRERRELNRSALEELDEYREWRETEAERERAETERTAWLLTQYRMSAESLIEVAEDIERLLDIKAGLYNTCDALASELIDAIGYEQFYEGTGGIEDWVWL